MKKNVLIVLAILCSFGIGFAFHSIITPKPIEAYKKVTGIGGIFFKCKDPKKLKEWYKTNLGLSTNEYGCVF